MSSFTKCVCGSVYLCLCFLFTDNYVGMLFSVSPVSVLDTHHIIHAIQGICLTKDLKWCCGLLIKTLFEPLPSRFCLFLLKQ